MNSIKYKSSEESLGVLLVELKMNLWSSEKDNILCEIFYVKIFENWYIFEIQKKNVFYKYLKFDSLIQGQNQGAGNW
jgi:hypothetical protein